MTDTDSRQNRQTYIKEDRQVDKPTLRQTDNLGSQPGGHEEKSMKYKKTDQHRQTDRQKDIQIGKGQIHRQMDEHIDRETDRVRQTEI